MENNDKILIKVKAKHGDGKEIAKMMHVTPEYVSCCFNGKKNSSLAKIIRKLAVIRGGDPIYENSINQ